MNKQDLNAARNEIIASFEGNVRSLVEVLNGLDNGGLGQWIVTCDGLGIDVTGKPGLGGMVVPLAQATRRAAFAPARPDASEGWHARPARRVPQSTRPCLIA